MTARTRDVRASIERGGATTRALRRVFVLAASSLTSLSPVSAFEAGPDLGLDPSAAAAVDSVTVLQDERIVITGNFDGVDGRRRRAIAVLHDDGRLDAAFGVDCLSRDASFRPQRCVIGRVLEAPDGSLLVAGNFHEIGGLARAGLAKLDRRTGAVDPVWKPFAPAQPALLAVFGRDVLLGAQGVLHRVALDGAGEAVATPIAATYSTTHNGRDTFFLARQQGATWRVRRASAVTGLVDPDWRSREFTRAPKLAYDPDADDVVAAAPPLPIEPSLQTQEIVALIDASGPAVEHAYWLNGQYAPWTGAIFVRDGYAYMMGQSSGIRVRRFDLRRGGAEDPAYVSAAAGTTLLGVDRSGRALLHRDHGAHLVAPIGSALLRLTASGQLDAGFNPRPRRDAEVTALARSSAGRMAFHGKDVTAVGALPVYAFFRVDADYRADPDWTPRFPTEDGAFLFETLGAMALDDQGRTYFGGERFDADVGHFPALFDRLHDSGERDPAWHAPGYLGAGNGIRTMLLDQANGWLYVGGFFDGEICGQPRRYLARVSIEEPCRADPALQPDPDNVVTAMTLDPLGRLYVGGSFENIGGQPIVGLARFDRDVLDAGWRPLAPAPGKYSVEKLAATADDVFAALTFRPTGGLPTQGLVRFDAVSGLNEMDWRPAAADVVADMLLTGSGHLVTSRRGLGHPSGPGVLEAFDPAGDGQPAAKLRLEPGQRIDALAQGREPDAVIVAGSFETLAGAARRSVAEVYVEPRAIFTNGFE